MAQARYNGLVDMFPSPVEIVTGGGALCFAVMEFAEGCPMQKVYSRRGTRWTRPVRVAMDGVNEAGSLPLFLFEQLAAFVRGKPVLGPGKPEAEAGVG